VGGFERDRLAARTGRPANAGKSWPKTDLFFLIAALARGMPSVEVAGFLARGEDEVQDKAKELGAHIPPQILGPGG
jgi:hypothetical protein